MAEWLYETGIGEARAALVADGRILEARIEAEGDAAQPGAICEARLTTILPGKRTGMLMLASGEEALITPLSKDVTEGAALFVEIVRSAIAESGRAKLARARHAPDATGAAPAPALADRLAATGIAVTRLGSHDPDRIEAAGWSELLEQAVSGAVMFPGGALRVALTPAMTVIDVDGALPPAELAIAGAKAAGEAIRRLDIAGSIGVDLPTLPVRTERQAAAAAFDAALPQPFERTAVNGFGFLQAIRRKKRASLLELAQYDTAAFAARAMLRRAERTPGTGMRTIAAHPAVAAYLRERPDRLTELERRIGAPVSIAADVAFAHLGGQISAAHP